MADERIIKIVLQTDEALRKLDEFEKRLDSLVGKASRVTVNASNAATQGSSTATGYGIEGSGVQQGSMIAPGQRPAISAGDIDRLAEQAVARMMQNLGQGIANATSKYAGGLPLSAAPAVSGMGTLPAMVSHLARQRGFASVDAMDHVSAQQVRARAEELVSMGMGLGTMSHSETMASQRQAPMIQPLARTGTGGPNEIQMGQAMGIQGTIAGGRSTGGGGRGGGGGGGRTPDMAPEWWLGGGGSEEEWHQFQRFQGINRVERARMSMEPRDAAIGPNGGIQGTPYGPFRPVSRMRQFGGALSEGFQSGNMAAFNLLMGGWAIGSGAMPIEQINAPAIQAAQQFTYAQGRGEANQALTSSRSRYGAQVLAAQQRWDMGQAGMYNRLADANLGGPLQDIGNAFGTVAQATNAAQPIALVGGTAIGTARALGVGAATVGAGIGVGSTALVGAGLQAGGELLANRFGGANLAAHYRNVAGAMPGPQGDAARLMAALGIGSLGGEETPRVIGQGLSRSTRTIIGRQQEEAQYAQDFAPEHAAQQEQLGRAQTGYSIASARVRMGIGEQQFAVSRRRFGEDQLIAGRRFDEDWQWAAEDRRLGFDRRVRDIGIGGERSREDLGISVGRQRADVGRNLGISQREIGISYGQSVEDINRSAAENQQDILLGSALTGVGGALIRNRIAQRRALAGAARGRDRALGSAGRSAGDAYAGIDIGAGRAGEDIDRGEGRGYADAARAGQDAADDAGRAEGRARGRFDEDQARAKQRADQDAEFQERLMALGKAEIDLRDRFNKDLESKQEDLIRIWERATTRMESAADKAVNDISGMFEGLAPG